MRPARRTDRPASLPASDAVRLLPAWRLPASKDGDDAGARLLDGRLAVAHRLWPKARSGDDAAAVAVAVDLVEAGRHGHDLDLAMWALVPLARRGNWAARLVLDHVPASLARRRAGRG